MLYIDLFVSFVYFIFSILLWRKNHRSRSRTILSFYFVSSALSFIVNFIFDFWYYIPSQQILNYSNMFFAPVQQLCLLFYVIELMLPKWLNTKKIIFLGIPLSIYILLFFVFWLLNDFNIIILDNWKVFGEFARNPTVWLRFVSLILILIFGSFTIAFVLARLSPYNKMLADNYSYTDRLEVKWLERLSVLVFALCLLFVAKEIIPDKNSLILYYLIITLLIGLVLLVKGLRQEEIQINEDTFPENDDKEDIINDSRLLDLKKELEKLFQEEKIYLDPELSLQQIALRLNTNRVYISRVFNMAFAISFNDYVNRLRVDCAIEMLSSPDCRDMTNLDIAMASGFKTDRTMYRAFTKLEGCPPGDYR